MKQTISFKFLKGCLPQILLGPFLNTLSHMILPRAEHKENMKLFENSEIISKHLQKFFSMFIKNEWNVKRK